MKDKKKGKIIDTPPIEERLAQMGITIIADCGYSVGRGMSTLPIRLQKGPISEKRGQNGITKEQLSLVAEHAMERTDI